MTLLKHLQHRIEAEFRDYPYRFFREHDIHSELASIVTDLLQKEGSLFEETCDKPQSYTVSRVHHEYPTPFRCDMRGYRFRVITEKELSRKRQKDPRFRARRGHIDLVVLNSHFISSNSLRVVSGRRIEDVQQSLRKQRYPALDLALEIVYHRVFDNREHIGIVQKRVASADQDYRKLLALMDSSHFPNNMPFCKEAAMLFFSNTTYMDRLNGKLDSISVSPQVPFTRIPHHSDYH